MQQSQLQQQFTQENRSQQLPQTILSSSQNLVQNANTVYSQFPMHHSQPLMNSQINYPNVPRNPMKIPIPIHSNQNQNSHQNVIFQPNDYTKDYKESIKSPTTTETSSIEQNDKDLKEMNLDEQIKSKILSELKDLSNLTDSNLRNLISKTCQLNEFKEFVQKLDKIVENN
ncbi:uncharacterized protein KGF55_000495 [Candida pseudojiufengensis]|uniref:uncharacterized protein n=1 Tax=Candida pseudojiufengensis TaxID=497109 RepID=UPI002224C9DD|nr:uncharacterized protein KGF55_000495 [Candida pseudojiufengensis]KAI5966186.1 hypothetical protein KGF55_000495 [Candida pseudojiufengensis]